MDLYEQIETEGRALLAAVADVLPPDARLNFAEASTFGQELRVFTLAADSWQCITRRADGEVKVRSWKHGVGGPPTVVPISRAERACDS